MAAGRSQRRARRRRTRADEREGREQQQLHACRLADEGESRQAIAEPVSGAARRSRRGQGRRARSGPRGTARRATHPASTSAMAMGIQNGNRRSARARPERPASSITGVSWWLVTTAR